MSEHSILWYAERAAVEYIKRYLPDWLPETQVYRGRENREDESMEGQESSLKVRPCVICSCTTAQAVLENWKGLWTVMLTVDVEANRAQTDGDTADLQAQEIFNLFLTTTIIPDLSGATPGFLVRDVIPKDLGVTAEGRAWQTRMSVNLEQACHLAT